MQSAKDICPDCELEDSFKFGFVSCMPIEHHSKKMDVAMGLEIIPNHHRYINGHHSGKTDRGLSFDLEVSTERSPLNTNARAKVTMALRERIMNYKNISAYEAFQRSAAVSVEGVEEKTTIMLRIADGTKIHRFHVDVSPDGFYSCGRERSNNLRQLVRDLAFDVEDKCGLVGQRMGM